MTDQHVLYAGNLSPYSNFYTMGHPFILDGITFNCVEQCYQYTKATLADDIPAALNIMTESDPVTMKRVGDAVKVASKLWNNNRAKAEMTRAVTAKFLQNPRLITGIKVTGSHVFAECNRFDNKWGIGLADPNADNESCWNWENWMGAILIKVRELL